MTNTRYYWRIGSTLLFICTAVALLLSVINIATRGRIADNEQKEKEAAISLLFPSFTAMDEKAGEYPDGVHTVYRVIQGDHLLGYAVDLETRGFGGPIGMVVGIDARGAVSGVRVLSHSETPGLGSRATLGDYLSRYLGLKETPVLGQDVDAITGATISSRAIRDGVALALSLDLGGDQT